MTSSINPNNIDGAYPVAGQDNDSQGFRDNFTNTKTNFQYASAEISDLQSKAVLKAALSGTTLNNDMGGSLLTNLQLQDFGITRVALGNVSGSQNINFAAGSYHTLTPTGSVSLAFTNFPTAGQWAVVRVQVTVSNTAYTLTLPAAVGTGVATVSAGAIFGLVSNTITFGATGTYVYEFYTTDAGSTIFIQDVTRSGYFGSEDLAASAAASLYTTASYFTTAAAETATLAAGSNGQIKTFMMAGDSGDMVITVTNAGWKSSGTGTITFDAIGDGCTLQYINSKWYCIGNNGAVFA